MKAGRGRDVAVRLLWRRMRLLVLLGLVAFGGWSVWGAWQKDVESAALNQESQAALATLSAQATTLQENITQLKSERGQEAELRQEYAVGKPGEDMIVIVDPATTTPAPAPPSIIQKIEKVFWWW